MKSWYIIWRKKKVYKIMSFAFIKELLKRGLKNEPPFYI
jgi:hypothetical protein